ncbi:ABC transporter substrate-binding protein [Rhodoplanes sp.]|uniref:ABC transporter substrate-binding protein n=1 Tax=Rhodoplanes sp. TaxID=1968906 RepID=UPI0025ED7DD9|nr:ABC transporter substrate-binding protein [Rhodoplanes sp.]
MLGSRSSRACLAMLALAASALLAPLSSAAAEDQLNVRFSWKMKGEYATYFLAQDKGLFKAANLDVKLGEGAGAQAALGALIQGQEDIVILPGVFALSAIQKGIPVKIIALYHPKTPVALITWPDKAAKTPKDLGGMTVAHSVGETGTSYLDAFLRLNKVDPASVKRTMMNAQARVPAFIQKQVDVVSVYQTNDLPIIREQHKGTDFVVIDMVEFGLSVPGMALVTSDQNITKKADALKRFLKASAAAIRDAKADPMVATQAIRKAWPSPPSETAVLEQVKATVGAIPVPQGHEIGWIDEKTISDALELLKSAGEIDAPKPTETYFTNVLLAP